MLTFWHVRAQAGAADGGGAVPTYDFLFEDPVEFITADVLAGDDSLLEDPKVREGCSGRGSCGTSLG